MAFPVRVMLIIFCNVLLFFMLQNRQYLLVFHYLFDSVLDLVILMERFGIQEPNGTAYIRLTCKLFIRCVKQF